MKKCELCGTRILFGPVWAGSHVYCGYECRALALEEQADTELPEGFVLEKARSIHAGSCPECEGEGPIDVHTLYKVWSFLVVTSFKELQVICCDQCGKSYRRQAALHCLLFGWWGFPWGILGTPFQIFKNLCSSHGSLQEPSPELIDKIRLELATELANTPPT